jgi:hypothetical protein
MTSYNYTNYNFATLKDEEVLFFIRNKGKRSYFNGYYPKSFLDLFESLKDFRTISEYKYDADVYIDLKMFNQIELSEEDKELISKTINYIEIIQRCRALREIPFKRAKKLILNCSIFFLNYYRNSSLKLIVCGTVDNYVMDIMVRLANIFGIHTIGITNFFLSPKYNLVTLYGENTNFRNPDESEVEEIYTKLTNKAKSALAISKYQSIKKAINEFFSYYYRYIFRYIIRFRILGSLEYEYQFAPLFKGFISLKQLNGVCYFDQIDYNRILNERENIFYIPLHYYPEATIDYWTDNYEKSDYINGIIEVIKFLNEKGKIAILKEHPAYFLSRSLNFYKEIKKFNNVILLNPFVLTQDILDFVDQLIIWNGSTGVEALMLDKKVSFVTRNYYSNEIFTDYKDFEKSKILSVSEKKRMIRDILRSTIRIT